MHDKLLMLAGVLVGLAAAYGRYSRLKHQIPGGAPGRRSVFVAIGLYIVHVTVGLFIILAFSGSGAQSRPHVVPLMIVFFLAWILFGAIWLLRLVPRNTPLPSLIGDRFNMLDAALLAGAALALAASLVSFE